jgi:protein-S-isoprenylcysteine O-methyltransferase Ste14
MTYAIWMGVTALYFPIAFTATIGLLRHRQPRMFPACLLGALWVAGSLPLVELLNAHARWWSFAPGGAVFCGMPLELYFGWIVWWGILPQIALDSLAIGWSAALLTALDVLLMPHLFGPLFSPRPVWLGGEGVAVLMVLVPALCIARWTADNTHLRARAAMQVAVAGMLFLYLVPQLVFTLRPGRGWAPLVEMPGWQRQLGLQALAILALPGVGAVMEFAERGLGTPIPYDPPVRLVSSGIYRYCANPMQLSCALVMLGWAGMVNNAWLLLAAVVAIVYSAGIAEWDESQDLARRFGAEWRQYRAEVRNWLPRWRPYHAGPEAQLYIAATCGPCSELRAWLEARKPVGMAMVDAETLAAGSIRRLRYDAWDGSGAVEGVRALGRALEHLNLGWTIAGIALRLPIVWQGVQLLMDASGLGPREVRQAL